MDSCVEMCDIPIWSPISHGFQCNVLWMWGGMNIYIFGIMNNKNMHKVLLQKRYGLLVVKVNKLYI